MAYTVIKNFNLGIDRRRPMYAPFDGAIWDGINCHLTRGGDLEKRKAFVSTYALPAGTFGLTAAGGLLYVFGSASSAAVPSGVTYQQLAHPDGTGIAMTAVLSSTVYDGSPYVVAKYADGAVYHFFGGSRVSSFVDGIVRASMTNMNGLVASIVTLLQADTAYTTTVSANVITITHNTVNTAMSVTSTVTNRGATNDAAIALVKTVAAAPGVAEKWTATFTGTFEVGDRYALTVDNKEFGCKNNPIYTPEVVLTFRSKVYGLAKSLLEFSGTGNAAKWNSYINAGAGYINLSTMDAGSAQLYGVGIYQGNLAVFARRVVQIWYIREDTAQNSLMQTLKNTGTVAPKSVLEYGDIDVFYLDDSGIRSIRARAPSNAAFVNDIGTTVDTYVRDYKATLTDTQIAAAVSTIEPLDGRYWLAMGTKIFVLSYFPTSEVSGWTCYDVGFQISDFATINDRVYARSGDTIYLYGGPTNTTYDNSTVTIQLPFINGGKPGTFKEITGIDISSQGTWTVDLLVNPRDTNAVMHLGSIDGVSWGQMNATSFAYSSHIAPRLISTDSGYCSLSNIGINFEAGDEL